MTRFVVLLGLLLVAAGALFATNPDRASFEAKVEDQLLSKIDGLDPNDIEDETARFLLATCKVGGAVCANLIGSFTEITIEDKLLFSNAKVSLGGSDPITCYGLLNKVSCPSL